MACGAEGGAEEVQLSRWMLHHQAGGGPSALRIYPEEASPILPQEALDGEVVEVMRPEQGPLGGFACVLLALGGAQGWVEVQSLHRCPEGTDDHGRLSSEGASDGRAVEVVELELGTPRFVEVSDRLRLASLGELRAERAWMINGHFLGTTGMVHGPKETLFHGTSSEAADSIALRGFDDGYAAAGKFGAGLYFSPEPLVSYGYGHELFLCEVALGTEEQRVTATECTQEHEWQALLDSGHRSVQCHVDPFGQEERVVYHCTQCKPVYRLQVSRREASLKRWMQHCRTDSIPKTSLRVGPGDSSDSIPGCSALNHEVVEVMDRSQPTDSYILVRLALSQMVGWVKAKYLQECPEGRPRGGALTGHGDSTGKVELSAKDSRFREVQELITSRECHHEHCKCKQIRVKRLWFVRGHYLGETGMKTGPKEVLFHGCRDSVVDQISESGFDISYASGGAFGRGLYFSPQSCKAWSYAENHLLICEVALGLPENRLHLTESKRDLDLEKVFKEKGKRSAQCHAGRPFNHEERIVYKSTQCKVVYIAETAATSPGGGI